MIIVNVSNILLTLNIFHRKQPKTLLVPKPGDQNKLSCKMKAPFWIYIKSSKMVNGALPYFEGGNVKTPQMIFLSLVIPAPSGSYHRIFQIVTKRPTKKQKLCHMRPHETTL
eukprot:TCONS_00017563-protein